MTTTAQADQFRAATAETEGLLRAVAARVKGMHYFPDAHRHPAVMRLMGQLRARASFGGVSPCGHVGPSPHPLAWQPWQPDRLVCLPCAAAEQRRIVGTVEDKTCDGCRRVVEKIHTMGVSVGPVMLMFGLCGACKVGGSDV